MQRKAAIAVALSLAAALALPGIAGAATAPQATAAASSQEHSVATLQVNGGVVMLSRDSGPFTSGATNDQLFSGERLMISAESSATVTFNDGCKQTYDKPGVYAISASCKLAALLPNSGAAGTTTGGLAGMTGGQAAVLMAASVVTGGLVGSVVSHRHEEQTPPLSR